LGLAALHNFLCCVAKKPLASPVSLSQVNDRTFEIFTLMGHNLAPNQGGPNDWEKVLMAQAILDLTGTIP
jgi:hypothetical protein